MSLSSSNKYQKKRKEYAKQYRENNKDKVAASNKKYRGAA